MKKIYIVASITIINLLCGLVARAQFSVQDKTPEESSPIIKGGSTLAGPDHQYKRRAINDGDFIFGVTYNRFADSLNSPYKKAIDIFAIRERLLADERIQLHYMAQAGWMSEGRKQWFADVLHSSHANVMDVPGAFRGSLSASLAAILLNRHFLGISVGPTAGLMMSMMPKVTMSTVANKYNPPFLLTPGMGLRANIYVSTFLYLSASYTSTIQSHYYNKLEGVTTKTPINGNFYSFGIGLRGLGMPVGTYFMPK